MGAYRRRYIVRTQRDRYETEAHINHKAYIPKIKVKNMCKNLKGEMRNEEKT